MDKQQKTLNAKLRGQYQYYGRPTNYFSIWQFYRRVCHIWREWLSRRTRGRPLTWDRSWKRRTQPKNTYSPLGLLYSEQAGEGKPK